MWLKHMKVRNFRSFRELDVSFDRNLTILIGSNGAGKSTVLEAVRVSLGAFLTGFKSVKSNAIARNDVRVETIKKGSTYVNHECYPVTVYSAVETGKGEYIPWGRCLNSAKGRTTVGDSRDIMRYAETLAAGEESTILPVVAYYGTGRLWAEKKTRKVDRIKTHDKYLGYRDCLEAEASGRILYKWIEDLTYTELQEGERLPELEAVRNALAQCYQGVDPGAKKVRVKYSVKLKDIEVTKETESGDVRSIPLSLMSDGIRITMMLVADIACRMAQLNGHLYDDVLSKTDGVVLIDEVDMHLHPAWQSRILGDLMRIFPLVQFIVTTHSPTVLANISDKHVLVLSGDKAEPSRVKTYGRNISAVLREIMGVQPRPQEIIDKLNWLDSLIDDGEYDKAHEILTEVRDILGENDEDVIRAEVALSLEED